MNKHSVARWLPRLALIALLAALVPALPSVVRVKAGITLYRLIYRRHAWSSSFRIALSDTD